MSTRRSLLSLGLPKDILAALMRDGYISLEDLSSVTPETLAKDLKIPMTIAQELVIRCQTSSTPVATLQTTQSAAVLVQKSQKLLTKCSALDKILDGGISRGQILEISGPPGSPKESLAINILSSFAEMDDEVVFIDCQNTINPTTLMDSLERATATAADLKRLVHYTRLHTLADLLLFMHQFPVFLQSHSKVSLLVINSVSAPFQSATLSISQKNNHLERVKQTLSKMCASYNLTIVTTSQLATKMVNSDGSPGTFDSGAKGIMLPLLGHTYLPNGKSHRVVLSPDGPASGFVKLMSSPKFPPGKVATPILEPYAIINGRII